MTLNEISAGEEQRHVVENAFNLLVNEGFLREQQGVHTLEVVQKFHEIINEPIGRATMAKKDLMDFCGRHFLPYYGVITLVKIDSTTNDKNFHAVRLSNFGSSVTPICGHPSYSSFERNGLHIKRVNFDND